MMMPGTDSASSGGGVVPRPRPSMIGSGTSPSVGSSSEPTPGSTGLSSACTGGIAMLVLAVLAASAAAIRLGERLWLVAETTHQRVERGIGLGLDDRIDGQAILRSDRARLVLIELVVGFRLLDAAGSCASTVGCSPSTSPTTSTSTTSPSAISIGISSSSGIDRSSFVFRIAERDQTVDLADQLVRRHRPLVDVLVGVNLEVAMLREAIRRGTDPVTRMIGIFDSDALLALLEHPEAGLLLGLLDAQ